MIIDHLHKLTNCSMCSIWLIDEETNRLEPFCGRGETPRSGDDNSSPSFHVPMMIGGKTAGEINLYFKDKHKPSIKNKKIISMMATYGAAILENTRLGKLSEKFANIANIDGLTQLYNHKYFHESLERELAMALRFKYPVCMVMLDIDHFKKYNDTYGHPAGDIVLKTISDIVKKNVRSYDMAARYGGEEMALILPHAITRQAYHVVERIRNEIMEYPFKGKGNERVKVTISIGLASFPSNASSKEMLIKRADQALYLAKEEGRNKTCSSLVTSKDLIKFAFCPPSFSSPYYTSILKGVMEVIEDVGNINLSVETSSSEAEYIDEQTKIIESFISKKVDMIAVCSKDLENIAKQIVRANKKNIPVFVFNVTESLPSGEVVSYIGYDNRKAGGMVGQYLTRLLRGKGNVAIIEGLPEISSNERKAGFIEYIKDYPEIKLVASEKADWERGKARNVSKNILKKHNKLDAIFAVSDEMALGALDSVIAAGKKNKIFTVGLDGNQNAFQSIKEGNLTATLNTNPVEMGRTLMRTVLRNMIKGERINKHIWLPIMMVSLDNVSQHMME